MNTLVAYPITFSGRTSDDATLALNIGYKF
jgi:hypothetical protein